MQYTAFGSIVLGIGIALYLRKKYGRALNIMFLLAGGALAPAIGPWITSALASLGGMLFGVSAAALLAALSLAWFIGDFKDKGKHPKTCWIALFLPVLLVASGVPVFLKVSDMIDQVGNQANTAVTQTR